MARSCLLAAEGTSALNPQAATELSLYEVGALPTIAIVGGTFVTTQLTRPITAMNAARVFNLKLLFGCL